MCGNLTWGNPLGVGANILNCDIIVTYNAHFSTNTLGKCKIPLIPQLYLK